MSDRAKAAWLAVAICACFVFMLALEVGCYD